MAHPIRILKIGDRVMLNRATTMDDAGKLGVVTDKYTPAHCTGVWSIKVRWDGNSHETSYPYPTGGLIGFAPEGVVL